MIPLAANCPSPVVEDSINFPPPTPENPPQINFTYGDRITIKCQECRRLVGGSANLICTQGGHWDGVLPSCECKLTIPDILLAQENLSY